MKYSYLQESPVRRRLQQSKEIDETIFESKEFQGKGRLKGIRDIVQDISNVLTSMEEHREDPLRIAIMGEVKAGKSTFLNVAAGKRIAYTDVLEATAIVSEITYAPEGEEYARVLDESGEVAEEFTFDELVEWMEDNAESVDHFQKFSKVVLGVCNDNLKDLILVDTPGLLSITEENHNTTSRYIYQADYIFWVLNSNNLGDKAVNDKLEDLKFMGKPVIGIVNQVDTPETLREIEQYVKDTYRGIFDDIFFVSSLMAWKGIEKNKPDFYEESGVEDILSYLRELAEDGEAAKKSCCDMAEAFQLHRELEVHEKVREDLTVRKGSYDNMKSELRRFSQELNAAANNKLDYWIKNELFVTEKTNLLKAEGEQVKPLLEQYASQEYLTRLVDQKYAEVLKDIGDSWNIVQKQCAVQPTQVEIPFRYEADMNAFCDSDEEQQKKRLDHVKSSVKTGATLGVALAGYAAWLGPAAVSIAFLPEALITVPVGAAFGLLWSHFTYDPDTKALQENAQKKEKEVERLYGQVIMTVEKEIKGRSREIKLIIDQGYKQLCENMKQRADRLQFSFEEPAYTEYMKSLEAYIQLLGEKLAEVEETDMVPLNPSEYMAQETAAFGD